MNIKHSIRLAKEKRKILNDVENELRKLKMLEKQQPGSCLNDIKSKQLEIKELLRDKFDGLKIRAKARHLYNNEKPSIFFTKREKDHANCKIIHKLETEKGEVSNMEDIKEEVYNYYKKLYNCEDINENVADTFLNKLPQLSDTERDLCEGLITEEE